MWVPVGTYADTSSLPVQLLPPNDSSGLACVRAFCACDAVPNSGRHYTVPASAFSQLVACRYIPLRADRCASFARARRSLIGVS